FGGERALVEVGAGISGKVPGGFHEGVHGVRLTPRLGPAFRAGSRVEGFVDGQGGAAVFQKLDIQRKHYRQVLLGDRHDTALWAVDDRNGSAPVALARNAPIAEPVLNRQ